MKILVENSSNAREVELSGNHESQQYTFHCPAKLNLFLKLLQKRSDGYHDLESLFVFTNLFDVLKVEKSAQFQIKISGEFANFLDEKNNLFTTIFSFFEKEFSLKTSVKINIEKNIPISAGLGGGSSNAASFMNALNEIFALNLSKENLQNLSLKFGSDIAFFFENSAAIVKGRGEKITTFPNFAPISALLVNPKIHLSTKEIFANFNANYSAEIATEKLLAQDVLTLAENLPNDLEKPAIASAGAILKIIENMKNHGAKIAKMSGSGSSCFAIFSDEKDLENTEVFFHKNFPNYFCKKIKILSTNHPLYK